MKLTGDLRDKVEAAETIDEKRALIAEAGIQLTDDELDEVAGGIRRINRIHEAPNRLPR